MKTKNFIMIYFLLIIFLLICDVRGITDSPPAGQHQLANLVSIQVNGYHRCMGIILNEKHILTAAHCRRGDVETFTIVPGAFTMRFPTIYDRRIFKILRTFYHPCITEVIINNENRLIPDVAILELNHQLVWSSSTSEVRWFDRAIEPFSEVTLIGWQSSQQNSMILATNKGRILSDEECRYLNPALVMHEKCISPMASSFNTERHDHGMPVFDENSVMMGMIVKEGNRDIDLPTTFLPIGSYAQFIKDTLNDHRSDVKVTDFPYVVSIWYLDMHDCGGIIISNTRIMTAGHCTYRAEITNFKVAAGSSEIFRLNTQVVWRSVIRISVYEKFKRKPSNFNRWNAEHDIAIMDLNEELPFNEAIAPAVISNHQNIGENCLIVRWKTLIYYSSDARVMRLKKSSGKIENELFCKQRLFMTYNQFCTTETMPLATGDDLGNPIVCHDKVVGIVVDVDVPREYQSSRPTVFLYVSRYLNFNQFRMSKVDPSFAFV